MILRGEIQIDMPGRELMSNIWCDHLTSISSTPAIQGPVYIGSQYARRNLAGDYGPPVVGRTASSKRARVSTRASSRTPAVSGFAECERRL